jgi:acyl carrier protein
MAISDTPLPIASVLDRVRMLLADVLQIRIEEISADSSPDTIDTWDSLHHLDLVLALEQDFGLQFTPEEIEQLLSVHLVADLVMEKLGSGTSH